jgi:uncharacterized membrane protein
MIEIIPNFHPLLIHFPIALIGASLLFHFGASLFSGHRLVSEWRAVARWTLWLAALSTLPAAGFGWLAFNSVEHDEAGHAAMSLHRQFALLTVFASIFVAGIALYARKQNAISKWQTLLVAGLFALVGATAWLGGEVVYRHGIGVLALPEKESLRKQSSENNAIPATGSDMAASHTHGDGHQHSHAH